MKPTAWWVAVAMLAVVLNSGAQTIGPPSAPAAAPASAPELAELQSKRKGAEEDPNLPPDVKAKTLDLYDRAKTAMEKVVAVQAELADLTKRIEAAPARIKDLKQRLRIPGPERKAAPPADATVEQLQGLLTQARAAIASAHAKREREEAALADLVTSGGAIVKEWVDREKNLRQVAEEAKSPVATDMPPALQGARLAYLDARRRLEEAEFGLLRLRATNYDLLVEVTTLERDADAADLTRMEAGATAIADALQRRREVEANHALREAEATQAAAVALPGPIAAVAQQNVQLRAELEEVVGREKAVGEELSGVSQQYRKTDSDLADLRDRIKTYGPSLAVGRLLQRELDRLPSARSYLGRARELREAIGRATERRIEVDDTRLALTEVEPRVDALLAETAAHGSAPEGETLRREATDLVTAQRSILGDLDEAYGRYLLRLTALQEAQRELTARAADGAEFIRKQLTWIPNLPPVAPRDLAAAPGVLASYFSPHAARESLDAVRGGFSEHRALSVASLLVLLGAFVVRRRAPHQLLELSDRTRRVRTDAFVHTVKALMYTLIAASAWASTAAVAGWHLATDPGEWPLAGAIGGGLLGMVVPLFAVRLLGWVTRADGLANRHFRWPQPVRESVHRELRWLGRALVPAVFLFGVASQSGDPSRVVAFGRPMLLLGLAALAVFVWRLFRGAGPFMANMRDGHGDGWLARLWFAWFPLLAGAPIALGAAAGLGYEYTARDLTSLLIGQTACLVIGLLVLRDLLLRWFYIAQRRSRFEAALKQREEARAERGQREDETEKAFFDIDVPEVDYRELGDQARSVVGVMVLLGIVVGVGALWSDILPTLGFLERFQLPISKVTLVQGVEQTSAVTLADVAIALLVLAGALFAARNLSGLLEFTILRRTRLDAGGHYAIVTLCQYLVVAIGFLAAFSTIGLQWSKLQWLIAALGVGLGFGLQEIVANFVSGIILLLERPVRIGDIVTVGGSDGYISRIRIRATTILTWERKELIVPNKEFITGQVINWTLSDGVNRIQLNVGVAYGADVGTALALMEEAAAESRHVLSDPKPIVTFEAFGDNALNLVMRCYLASMEHRLATITDLHRAVYEKFSRAGIVIAFPQRDVHLDTAKPLEIRLARETVEPATGLREAGSGGP